MSRLVILAAVVALAVSSASCANSPDQANLLGPSALDASGGVSGALARGGGSGGGGGKGKPGGGTTGGSGSLALKMVTDLNADGLPNWGDSVRFDVSTTRRPSRTSASPARRTVSSCSGP